MNHHRSWAACAAAGAVLALALCCLMPPRLEPMLAIPLYLAFGWIGFLIRVLPELTVNYGGVATAAVCLLLFVAGAHRFATWIYRELKSSSPDALARLRAGQFVQIGLVRDRAVLGGGRIPGARSRVMVLSTAAGRRSARRGSGSAR